MKTSHLKIVAISSCGSCESKLVRKLNIKHILKVTIFVSHMTVVEYESKCRQSKMEDELDGSFSGCLPRDISLNSSQTELL